MYVLVVSAASPAWSNVVHEVVDDSPEDSRMVSRLSPAHRVRREARAGFGSSNTLIMVRSDRTEGAHHVKMELCVNKASVSVIRSVALSARCGEILCLKVIFVKPILQFPGTSRV